MGEMGKLEDTSGKGPRMKGVLRPRSRRRRRHIEGKHPTDSD